MVSYRRVLVGLVAVAALTLTPWMAAPAAAAPAEQACRAGGTPTQHDMAGTYVSAYHGMRVEMYACGGSYVQWENAFGTHYASYYTVTRVPREGVIARPMPESPERLDNAQAIGFKAAEPGYIQVFTVDAYGDERVYRLRKIA